MKFWFVQEWVGYPILYCCPFHGMDGVHRMVDREQVKALQALQHPSGVSTDRQRYNSSPTVTYRPYRWDNPETWWLNQSSTHGFVFVLVCLKIQWEPPRFNGWSSFSWKRPCWGTIFRKTLIKKDKCSFLNITTVLPCCMKVAFQCLINYVASDVCRALVGGVTRPRCKLWEKRPGAANSRPKGVCHLCCAGQIQLPFKDFRENGSFFQETLFLEILEDDQWFTSPADLLFTWGLVLMSMIIMGSISIGLVNSPSFAHSTSWQSSAKK